MASTIKGQRIIFCTTGENMGTPDIAGKDIDRMRDVHIDYLPMSTGSEFSMVDDIADSIDRITT